MSDYKIFWSVSRQISHSLTIEDSVPIQHTNYKMGRVLKLWNKMDFVVSDLVFFFKLGLLVHLPKDYNTVKLMEFASTVFEREVSDVRAT